MSQLVKKLCDGVVRLDMAAQGTGVDSYNVSVAAGISMYRDPVAARSTECVTGVIRNPNLKNGRNKDA